MIISPSQDFGKGHMAKRACSMDAPKLLVIGTLILILIAVAMMGPFFLTPVLRPPPPSVSECFKINTSDGSGDLNDCVDTVAEIKSDPKICDYRDNLFNSYSLEWCLRGANFNYSKNGTWSRIESEWDGNSLIHTNIDECLRHAVHTNVTKFYYETPYGGYSEVKDYVLDTNISCRGRILSATQDSCNVTFEGHSNQDEMCVAYVALYQGIYNNMSAYEICSGLGQSIYCYMMYALITDEPEACSLTKPGSNGVCFRDYAIIHRDIGLCEDAAEVNINGIYLGYADSCYLFFALDSNEEGICDSISDPDRRHKCIATILANKGE